MRVILGIGLGLSTVICPMYVSENANSGNYPILSYPIVSYLNLLLLLLIILIIMVIISIHRKAGGTWDVISGNESVEV